MVLGYCKGKRFINCRFKNPSPSRPLMCGRCRAAIFVAPHPALSAEPPAVLHLPALSRPLATLPSTAMTTLDLAARIGANPAKFFFNAAKTLQTRKGDEYRIISSIDGYFVRIHARVRVTLTTTAPFLTLES